MKTVVYVHGTEKVQDRRRLAGLSEYARRRGWNLQPVEALKSPRQARELVRIWKPDGFIVCRGAALNDLPARCFCGVPVVFSHNPGTVRVARENCIFSDAGATVEMAARELLSLNLAEYAFVGWMMPIGWSVRRKDSFASIMSMHGRRVHVFEPSEHRCSPNTIAAHLAKWLAKLPRPLGVLAANDQIAARTVSACSLAGLSVPDDVSVVGIDNDEALCEGSHPTITSVDPDFAASGRIAGEAIDRLMSDPGAAPVHVAFPPLRLVRRESTRRFERRDACVSRAVERIRREACGGLSAADVAKDFPCSRRMAEIRFRSVTGRSILQEIRRVRLETAQHLLRTTASGIDYVAGKCGYGSLSAFSLFFHREAGVSPSAYRAGGT